MASFKNLISNTSAQIASGGTITGDLVINGDLQVDGGGSLSFDEIIEGTSVIDVTDTEAFLVRKDSDGGDVFVVDTTNSRVGIGGTPHVNSTLNVKNSSGTAFLYITSANDFDSAIVLEEASTAKWIIGNDGNDSDKLKFGTGGGWGTETRMTLDSSGNLALSASSPQINFSGSAGDYGTFGYTEGDPDVFKWALFQNSGQLASITMDAVSEASPSARFRFNVGGDTDSAIVIDSSKRVGIGLDNPNALLEASGTSAIRSTYTGTSSAGVGGALQLVQDDGSAIESGHRIGYVVFGASEDSSNTIHYGGSINAFATETYSATGNGTKLTFDVTANGATSRATALTIDQDKDATFSGDVITEGKYQISNATPELLFAVPSGGLDSRIHNDGSGNLIFGNGTNSTTPTEAMRIDSSQNTTFSGTITATSASDNVAKFESSDAIARIVIEDNASENNGNWIAVQNDVMSFATNGSNTALTLDSSQNATFAGDILVANATPSLSLQDTDGTNQISELLTSGATTYLSLRNASSHGSLVIRGYNGSAYSTALTIDSSQNVGIGASPTEKLTIFGGVGSPASSGTGANGNLAIESSNGNSLYIGSYSASPYGVWLQTSNYTDQSLTYPLILNPRGGNVGIGTTSPMGNSDGIVGLEISSGASTGLTLKSTSSSQVYSLWADASGNLKIQDNTNNLTRLTIDSSGNFIVGGNLELFDNTAINFGDSDDSQFFNTGSAQYFRNNSVDMDFIFQVNDGGSTQTEVMRIDASESSVRINGGGGLKISGALHSSAISLSGADGVVDGLVFAQNSSIGFLDAGSSYMIECANDDSIKFSVTDSQKMKIDANSRISLSNNDSGTSNTVFGKLAGVALASGGQHNLCIGEESGHDITTGDNNVSVGSYSNDKVSTNGDNTAIGYEAHRGDGGQNTVVGSYAVDHESGQADSIVAVGHQAMRGDLTSGADGTVAVGAFALNALTSGADNVAVGYNSFSTLTTGDGNTSLGSLSGQYNVTGSRNTYIGYASGLGVTGNSNSSNVGLGYFTLKDITTGGANTVVGAFAGDVVTTQDSLTLVGKDAGSSINHNDANGTTAIGAESLALLTNGRYNTAVGFKSLETTANGDRHTAVGYQALGNVTGASDGDNTAIGFNAGHTGTNDLTSGTANTLIGSSTAVSSATGVNQTVIGQGATGIDNNSVTLGNSSVTEIGIPNASIIRSQATQSFADDATLTIMASQAGGAMVYVYDSSSGGGGAFFVTYADGAVKVAGSSNVTNSDSDGSLCVFKSTSSHGVTIKNRLGATKNIAITVMSALSS